MKKISFNTLLKYHFQQLSDGEKDEIRIIIQQVPYYKEILDGIGIIEAELKEGESIEEYLEILKRKLKKEIFEED